ncbi:ABC transporter substrate-binding protein [Aldersonia sp. NBC_00410]|uniref:ABC transporter substrate-binding protein n=1 Tax=Aldersonia sp. NBC_00410 TaxID=2975954 RepID=UPI002255F423|nr:ABC transporter substrate-binding protein [Aldersonia sp. NBC_00410]MCX5043808.1 ABC transporter substrate-binding protein [Aldersonia sp. NBC_00410]
MRTRSGRILAALAASAMLVLAAGCSSDDDSGSSDTSSAAQASGTKATGTPVKIGLFDPSAGPITNPGVAVGADAAVDYINNTLGGLNGQPIELVPCAVDGTSPESTIGCANQFVQGGVVATVDGYNTTSSAALPILQSAGIPMIGQIPFDSVTGARPDNRVYFAAPQASFLIGALQSFQAQGKKSVTLVVADLPATHQTVDAILGPVGQQMGITVTGQYYAPANPNFTAVASAIKNTNPDVGGLMASPDEATCTKLAQSLDSVGYEGTKFMAACTDFIETLGAKAAGAEMYSPIWLPQAKDSAPQLAQEQLDLATGYIEDAGDTADFYTYSTFGTFVNIANALNTAKSELTGPAILATLKGLTDFQSFLGPVVSCNKPTSPNCTTQMLMYEVGDDQTITPIGEGYITPNPQIMAMIPGAT